MTRDQRIKRAATPEFERLDERVSLSGFGSYGSPYAMHAAATFPLVPTHIPISGQPGPVISLVGTNTRTTYAAIAPAGIHAGRAFPIVPTHLNLGGGPNPVLLVGMNVRTAY
jgi:hypothetical protein